MRKRFHAADLEPEVEPELPFDPPVLDGRVKAIATREAPLPAPGEVRRYILTCAQNNTLVHEALWKNLREMARVYDAAIMVSRFTYDVSSYGKGSVKPGKEKASDELWYDPAVAPFVADERVQLAPGLVWCGEMNILPTAVRPLSGLESYTGRQSAIVPHAKLAMDSVASGKHEATKFNYTTGTATLRNYIAKKAGLKAEFHHSYGALLVEVDSEGSWWVRQLCADSDGTIHDLDVRVQDGRLTTGHSVEAVTWGDVHTALLDHVAAELAWGPGGLAQALSPKFQFFHDLVDFRARNHHDSKNPHARFQRYVEAADVVQDEIKRAASVLNMAREAVLSTGGKLVVVDSNHDNALERWLREADYRLDPPNAIFFLEAQLARYRAILHRWHRFHVLEWAMQEPLRVMTGSSRPDWLRFLRQDESFVICHDLNGGIECGMHGHLGPNGLRGAPTAFARMGRKSNTGHTHAAGIVDGCWTAGLLGKLDMDYNRGPSNWSHSHIVTHSNGKRQIVTFWKGKYRA